MNQSVAQAGVLYIDDTVCKLDDFKSQFRHLFTIYTAPTIAEGCRLLALNEIAVVIVNQLVSGSTCISFLESVAETNPHVVRILLTGFSGADTVARSIVYKTIAKPWQNDDLKYTIQNALEVYDLRKRNFELTHKLNIANYEIERISKQRG
ncbi:response regulator [Mucilaginibacter sp.]|uniref:response regulator n=1 Tax=Mucilaginibacter sp. TaxID=1882438 RepID=UPI002ED114DF